MRPKHVRRSCGKYRYKDAEEVKRALRASRQHDRDQVAVRWYHCPKCNGYHLTSRP